MSSYWVSMEVARLVPQHKLIGGYFHWTQYGFYNRDKGLNQRFNPSGWGMRMGRKRGASSSDLEPKVITGIGPKRGVQKLRHSTSTVARHLIQILPNTLVKVAGFPPGSGGNCFVALINVLPICGRQQNTVVFFPQQGVQVLQAFSGGLRHSLQPLPDTTADLQQHNRGSYRSFAHRPQGCKARPKACNCTNHKGK